MRSLSMSLTLTMRQLSAPQSGRVERHQKDPVEKRRSRVDQSGDLLGTEDLGQTESLPWIGRLGDAPRLPQRGHKKTVVRRFAESWCSEPVFVRGTNTPGIGEAGLGRVDSVDA